MNIKRGRAFKAGHFAVGSGRREAKQKELCRDGGARRATLERMPFVICSSVARSHLV